jgi:hypothetical protein
MRLKVLMRTLIESASVTLLCFGVSYLFKIDPATALAGALGYYISSKNDPRKN